MSQPVECPICFNYIEAKHIQRHVDRCIDQTQIETDRYLANAMESQPKQPRKTSASKNSTATASQPVPKSGARTTANTGHVIVNNAPANYQVVTHTDQSRAADQSRADDQSRAADQSRADPIQAQLSVLHEQLVKLQTQQAQINHMKQLAPGTHTPPPSPHTPRQLPVTVAPGAEHVTAQQRFAQQLAQFQQKFQNWHVPMVTRVEPRPAEDVKVSAPIDFSASELEQFDSKWLRTLKRNPEDERTLITAHLDMVLTLPQHRLGATMQRFAQSWHEPYQRMSEPSQETLAQVTELLDDFAFRLLDKTVKHYEPLRHPQRVVYAREAIRSHVQCAVYEPLFALVCRRYEAEDLVHSERIAAHSYVHPAHLGIKRALWLTADIALDPDPRLQPYARAIASLQLIGQYKLASSKLACLVEAATSVCSSVLEHWRATHPHGEPAPVIGGDELLPLMAYTLIKANVPHIYAHVAYMELFIDEQAIMQQQGYLLATAQTALALICCLDGKQIEQALNEVADSTVRNAIEVPRLAESDPTTAGPEPSARLIDPNVQ